MKFEIRRLMLLVIALVMVSGSAGIAHAQPKCVDGPAGTKCVEVKIVTGSQGNHWLIPDEPQHFLFIGASVADVAMTQRVLGLPGGRELNPIYGNDPHVATLVAVHGFGYAGLKWGEEKLRLRGGWKWVYWGIPTGLFAWAAVHNHQVGR